MAKEAELHIGEYSVLDGGVSVATVTGERASRVCSVLAIYPPFRNPEEARKLDLDEEADNEARDIAETAAGCSSVVEAIYGIDETVDALVFSKNGILAVRGVLEHPDDDAVYDLIAELDDNNAISIHEI